MSNEKPGQQFELHVPRRSTKLECNSSVDCHNPRISLRFDVPCLIEQDSFGSGSRKLQDGRPSLESILVDRALDNLPSATQGLDDLLKKMNLELTNHQERIISLKERLCKEEERLSNANADFAQVQWRTWIMREQLVEYERRCTSLKQDIDLQTNETVALEFLLEKKNLELDESVHSHEIYSVKMREHMKKVEMMESYSPLQLELKEQQFIVSELIEKKDQLILLRDKQDDLMCPKGESQLEEERLYNVEVDSLLELIEEEKNKQEKMKRSIDVLNKLLKTITKTLGKLWKIEKRNAAQKTRLKKQLKEVAGRNRHWVDQACHLRNNVEALKRQLEKD